MRKSKSDITNGHYKQWGVRFLLQVIYDVIKWAFNATSDNMRLGTKAISSYLVAVLLLL